MKKTSIEIPSELHRDFKIKCAKIEKSMNSILIELITTWLNGAEVASE